MLAFAFLLLALEASAIKRMGQNFSFRLKSQKVTRLDAIVNPDKVAGHVHEFVGTSTISESLTYDLARAGSCSTSPVQDDKSAYWFPKMYYKYTDGTFIALEGQGAAVYWKYTATGLEEDLVEMPKDFRMVAGNTSRDFLDASIPSHNAVSFQCYGPGYDMRLNYIPADFECETIRPQVFFPACWDGQNAYLDGSAHVAYPLERYEGGPCPDTHPKRIAVPFIESFYIPSQMVPNYEWYPGCLVLSNGDVSGLTYHADFYNAWPEGTLLRASDECELNGSVEGCSVFEASLDHDKADNCKAEGSDVAEDIGLQTPLAALPGNNPVYNASRDSSDFPKKPRTDYVEVAMIVSAGGADGGVAPPSASGDQESSSVMPTPSATASADSSGTISTGEVESSTATSIQTGPPTADAPTGVPMVSSSTTSMGGNTLIGLPEKETVTVTKTERDSSCTARWQGKRRLHSE